MSDYAFASSAQPASRVFRRLLAFAFCLGPLSLLAHWSASRAIAVEGCEPVASPPALLATVGPETVLIAVVVMVLATAGALCALNAWRYLQIDVPANVQTGATTARFLALCAIAGGLVFAIVTVFNAAGLALLPACA